MTSHEILAFDLYGTLVDPIAIAGELGQALGDSGGREAAALQPAAFTAARRQGRAPTPRPGVRR